MSAIPESCDRNHYHFDLPESLIALRPVEPRDRSRLMVVNKKAGLIQHRLFGDITDLMQAGDVLVANHTRVRAARLLGRRLSEEESKGVVEVFLVRRLDEGEWEALIRCTSKRREGMEFEIIPSQVGVAPLRGRVLGPLTRGAWRVEFGGDPLQEGMGWLPLPPYIEKGRSRRGLPRQEAQDQLRYQTVFAKRGESIAAPTAGLHFTEALRSTLLERGVEWCEINLDVGLGTFQPIESQDLRGHRMHRERYTVPDETASTLNRARQERRLITAVGTTTLRALESSWNEQDGFCAGEKETEVFFRPGGDVPRAVDRLITNFHLPQSSLFILVCSILGRELALHAYSEAVREGYRFFSYGDAMWIE